MSHPLEVVVDTKYGPRQVTGALAFEAKHGKLAEVVRAVEEIEEAKAQRALERGR